MVSGWALLVKEKEGEGAPRFFALKVRRAGSKPPGGSAGQGGRTRKFIDTSKQGALRAPARRPSSHDLHGNGRRRGEGLSSASAPGARLASDPWSAMVRPYGLHAILARFPPKAVSGRACRLRSFNI